MEGVFVDREYSTMLGTSFYNRVSETRELRYALNSESLYTTIIVYWPRNVGKSELVRYMLKRDSASAILVDARETRLETLPPKPTPSQILNSIRNFTDLAGSPFSSLLAAIVSEVLKLLPALKTVRGNLVLVVDEFHLLPGYEESPARAVRDLEAVAGELAKKGVTRLKLLVTVSEGFFVKADVASRLQGYACLFMLVEHMDYKRFRLLYEEYSGRYGPCSLGAGEVYALVGGAPGYIRELCRANRRHVRSLIREWLENLEYSLSVARRRLRLEPRDVIALAHRVLTSKGLRPLVEPVLFELGEILVERNIAYPRRGGKGVEYRPQLPAYLTALELAVKRGVDSILALDPDEVYGASIGEST